MKTLSILHVTDFHVSDPSSPKEKLRDGFYKDYINGLVKEIERGGKKIDYLILTGDFVDRGAVHNFNHVSKIVEHLTAKLKLKKSQTALCIGNHDVILKYDKRNDKRARKDFNNLAKGYTFGKTLASNDIFQLSRNSSSHYLLSFDSTFGSKGTNLPSELSDKQIDEVVNAVQEQVPESKLLFILSHYPMILFPRAKYVTEEENWLKNHLWKSGQLISERIFEYRENSPTFWFFGDGHIPDFCSYEDCNHFLMTGMVGGDFLNPTYLNSGGDKVAYNKTNEVKIISAGADGMGNIEISTLAYKSSSYTYSAHLGKWETTPSKLRKVVDPFGKNKGTSEAVKKEIEISNDAETEIISSSVQEEIVEQIQSRKLYLFDRFATSDKTISLGWISIYRLFESKELLSRCVEKAIEWLDKKISISSKNTIFIGIDFWGSILATQVSVRKNVKNFCVATKSGGKHYTELEKVEKLCDRIKAQSGVSHIVFFTDVISTGNTVISLKQKLSSTLQSKFTWVALSVISDRTQIRDKDLDNFKCVGTFCGDLRIPILKKEDLPNESILPVKYDIS